MSTMNVIFSNRVEQLMQQLADRIASPVNPDDVLAPEYVLIDNKVLGQWINLELAKQHDIAANIEYIQPSGLFWKMAKWMLGDALPQETPLLKDEMKWKLFALLRDENLLAQAVMQPVRHYLEGENCRELKQFQLAVSIADLFDQYQIYRPQWLLDWQQGKSLSLKVGHNAESELWQRELWQRLGGAEGGKTWHRAAIEEQLLALLHNDAGNVMAGKVPLQRLFVFGISSMYPSLLKLLEGIGRHIEVTLLVLNPCQEYWGLVKDARAQARMPDAGDDLYYEIGNPLLASQGVQVQEFIELLQDCHVEAELFVDMQPPETLLQAIQREILHLQYRGESARDIDYVISGEKQPIPAADLDVQQRIPSLHIHQCHSPQREVEVLHEQIRDMLAKNPAWNPRDIVVMMPKVANYVPYIHAVFNSVEERQRIPYHITDRTLAEESPLLNSFVSLLKIADSRLLLSEVLSLLEVAAVQKRFGLDQAGFEQLRQWLIESGVRWGADGRHRAALGLPDYAEYSWQFALDRMLAGYGQSVLDQLSADELLDMDAGYSVMPLDEIEGGNAALLDSFLQFWQKLQALREAVARPRSLEQWHEYLMQLLQDFYDAEDEDDVRALAALRTAIADLYHARQRGWYDASLGIAVIRDLLKPALNQSVAGRHSWQEGVKFCSLLPMRAVPFRVVYMMGMNQADYPRQVERKSFDLMRNNHRPGDRASRIDDRWLFLEALLSARDVFHVSYIARDMHRNEKRETSVVLSELTDYLEHGYQWPQACKKDDWLYTQHPLQPFSASYFVADKSLAAHRLLSFDRQAYAIASARAKSQQQAEAPVAASRWQQAPTLAKEVIEVSLNDFVRFFTRPWEWFLSCKFRLDLEVQADGVEDEEPFTIGDSLASWNMRKELLDKVNGQPEGPQGFATVVQDYVQVRKAKAQWPLGRSGDVLQQDLADGHEFYYASHGKPVSQRLFEYSGQSGNVLLNIRGQLPVYADADNATAVLLIHTPSNGKKSSSKSLELFIKFAIACLAKEQEGLPMVVAAECIYRDGTLEIPAGQAGQMRFADFMKLLTGLYLAYRDCGLPFDLGIADKIADIVMRDNAETVDEEALYELLDEYWYGSESSDGALADISKQTYFGTFGAITDKAFAETCCLVYGFIKEFTVQLQDAEKAAKQSRGKK